MLQEAGSKMNVVKNSVASHVFQNIGLTGLKDHLIGMNALVYGQDPIAFIKKVFSFKEKNKVLEIKCGWIEGTLVTDEDIRALSKIPSREHLLAQAVGAIASPLARLRFILEQFLVKFVSVIKGIQKKNEQRGD
jgi:large subunit ribosomal protein L10